jgi:hypothetical protein
MESQRFESKVDLWLVAVIVASFALPVVLAISNAMRSGLSGAALMLLIGVVPPALLVGFVFRNTYYVVTDEAIIANCLFRRTMPLASVTSLRPTRNPLSAPALSLDRIEILSGSGSRLLVSPKDRDAFVRAVVSRAPRTALEGF